MVVQLIGQTDVLRCGIKAPAQAACLYPRLYGHSINQKLWGFFQTCIGQRFLPTTVTVKQVQSVWPSATSDSLLLTGPDRDAGGKTVSHSQVHWCRKDVCYYRNQEKTDLLSFLWMWIWGLRVISTVTFLSFKIFDLGYHDFTHIFVQFCKQKKNFSKFFLCGLSSPFLTVQSRAASLCVWRRNSIRVLGWTFSERNNERKRAADVPQRYIFIWCTGTGLNE